jgi:hypothetical protein
MRYNLESFRDRRLKAERALQDKIDLDYANTLIAWRQKVFWLEKIHVKNFLVF